MIILCYANMQHVRESVTWARTARTLGGTGWALARAVRATAIWGQTVSGAAESRSRSASASREPGVGADRRARQAGAARGGGAGAAGEAGSKKGAPLKTARRSVATSAPSLGCGPWAERAAYHLAELTGAWSIQRWGISSQTVGYTEGKATWAQAAPQRESQ